MIKKTMTPEDEILFWKTRSLENFVIDMQALEEESASGRTLQDFVGTMKLVSTKDMSVNIPFWREGWMIGRLSDQQLTVGIMELNHMKGRDYIRLINFLSIHSTGKLNGVIVWGEHRKGNAGNRSVNEEYIPEKNIIYDIETIDIQDGKTVRTEI